MRRAPSFGSALTLSSVAAIVTFAVALEAGRPVAFARSHPLCSAPAKVAKTRTSTLGFGTVRFANTCSAGVQDALDLQVAKLDSFEAEASDFAAIAKRDPQCGIAWWGAAMSARGNPLGGSLDEPSLAKGRAYADRALALPSVSPREKSLIEAMSVYYRPYPSQIARARAYADRMDAIHAAYPDDATIAAFDGLAIIEGVDLSDKTYARQKRAGAILEAVMKAHPENPGAPHFLIHAYDYTALAPLAVRAAEMYPTLASASSHAQHMPAHIWSMLGRWDKSIDANRKSEFLADPNSAHGAVSGDIVFEHAFDFIAYARLQKGEDKRVGEDLAALRAASGMPTIVVARYALERGDWADAARVPVPVTDSFDAALARFTRSYGAARAGDAAKATTELAALKALREPVKETAGAYWAEFVDIYVATANAWILKAQGKDDDALAAMRVAADRDDGHEKHIYLENKILPMREALGDLELATGHPKAAREAYAASLKLAPNRYRSFLGAAKAAEADGDASAARSSWSDLVSLARDGDKSRPGFAEATAHLASKG